MEANNMKAMREALVFLRDNTLWMLEGNVRHCIGLTVFGLEQVCKIMRGVIEEALSAPARNCDVGTPEEQDARFGEFCVTRRTGSCAGCPDPVGGFTVANGIRECALVWAQMPYEANEISRAHRAGEHNNKPNNEGINNE